MALANERCCDSLLGKEVLIRMARMGVCGSDVHYYVDGKIGSQIVAFPWTVGHEGAGVVERIGADVTRVKVGDRVALDPAMPCYECDQCLAGRQHTCRKLLFLGCPGQVEGCLAQQIVMPETSVIKVPDSMSFEEAALVEPLSISLYGATLYGDLAGKKVGVLGAGPIGLFAQLVAQSQGAPKVYVTDKIDSRLELARRIGADWVGNVNTLDVVSAIDALEPDQLDVVFECCGQQDAIDQAVRIVKPGGDISLIGIPVPDRISFDISLLRRKEIRIQNVRRQNRCMEPALQLLASGKIQGAELITHRLDFKEADKAFAMVADYKDGVVKHEGSPRVAGDEHAHQQKDISSRTTSG